MGVCVGGGSLEAHLRSGFLLHTHPNHCVSRRLNTVKSVIRGLRPLTVVFELVQRQQLRKVDRNLIARGIEHWINVFLLLGNVWTWDVYVVFQCFNVIAM